MQKLQVLKVRYCDGMKEVFETQLGTSSDKKSGCDEGIPRVNNNVIMLPNLKILAITGCDSLEHIFTFSALESLRQLQELTIEDCKALKVIVKKEEEDASSSSSKEVVVFPRLKSIELVHLPELVGFFLGMNEFRWPSLDKVVIIECPKMVVFTPGGSTAPQLKYMHTGLGKHTLEEFGLNFHVTAVANCQTPFPSLHGATSCPATSEGTTWSFHNLIELDVESNRDVNKIIPSSELLQLQKLEKICISKCYWIDELFEALEAGSSSGRGSGFDESSQTTTTLVKLPNLTHVELEYLDCLRYIWKSNQWTAFEFPNLTRVEIEGCERLEYVFTSSMVGSLLQLQELHISNCNHLEEVIVKEAEDSDGKRNEILVLPRLKSLILEDLDCLKGFSLGKEDFSFPLLDTLIIQYCPTIMTFTKGNSATPQLKEIVINFSSFYAAREKDINSIIKIKQEIDTLSEDTHVRPMIDAEANSILKPKVLSEAEVQAKAKAKAEVEEKAVQVQAEVEAKVGAKEVQTEAEAEAEEKGKGKGKAKAEAEAVQVEAEAEAKAEAKVVQAATEAKAKAKATHVQAEAEVQRKEIQAKVIAEAEAEAQAQSLFLQLWEPSDDVDPDLYKIGEEIVRKCCRLPIAIKTMALTLRNKSKDAWKDALSRLEHIDITTVAPAVFEMSYDNLQDGETRSIFLLCGLFPKDFAIPTEELVRYGWGLEVFDGVDTIRKARSKLTTCIERLIHANLLNKGDDEGCVTMDDMVRAFVLDMFSKVEHASIVNHGSMPGWPESDLSRSCQRISLACEGISQFPRELKLPNLTILKLMNGDKSLRFPPDFYDEMKTLQVISYDEMKYPLLPSLSPQCINLRVLHLHKCSLMFDCSSIGNLSSLEVLSFANSGIEWLPSTIGNLKELRVLDLTDCDGLHIDNGVFKNLVQLEELYAIAGGLFGKAINFTDDNCNEMAERSRNLSALDFEFFRNNAQLKNMSFENLERFKISVGRSLDGDFSKSKHLYENTLQLVTDVGEISDSGVNKLFEKTEVLCLSVGDMNDLSDVDVTYSHRPRSSSFNNVRVLVVSRCEELRYIFTLGVAQALSKLEHLQVSLCNNMEELIHIEGSGEDTVTFPKLKFLSLAWLQNLSGLCHNVNIVELPQLVTLELDGIPNFRSIYPKNELATSCLLNKEVVIPKLEKLIIFNMENLKEIWPREFSTSEEVKLRNIEVGGCDNLVNLFPCNPMPLLHHLEEIKIENCGSIKSLFNIDLECVGEIGEESNSSLRSIQMKELGKLREVWRIKGENNSHLLIHGFEALKSIQIERCKSFMNVFTPATTNFDLGALVNMNISDCGERGRNNESVDYSQEEENNLPSNEDTLGISNNISNVVFPSYLRRSFHTLRALSLSNWEGVPEVVFEIESPKHGDLVTTQDYQQPMLPYLEKLDIIRMERTSHVWKCNWSKFFILQKEQSETPFHNLTTIYVKECESIKYLFSPLMAKLLSNLKKVQIQDCDAIEKVVSKGDDEDDKKTTSTSTQAYTTVYPCLDSLTLSFLPNLKCIGDGANCGSNELSFENTSMTADFIDQSKFTQVGGVSWTLCQYSKEISISYCESLSSVIPCSALGQMQKLQVLRITRCDSMKEVFESQGVNNNTGCGSSSIDEGNSGTSSKQGLNYVTILKLPMLRVLEIKDCDLLEYIFTFSTLQSLSSLEEIIILDCKALKVIVKEEGGEQTTPSEDVVFPCLKSIELENLPELEGFFLGKNEFRWPLLDDVTIKDCPQMRAFTVGQSLAPGLKYIRRSLGKHSLDERGLNFDVTTTAHHQTPVSSLEATSSCSVTAEGLPWSFHNLIELDVQSNISLEKIIPSNELLQLQNLEKIHVSYCHGVEEVFEALEGTSSGLDESQTVVVELPNLTEVNLAWVDRLRNMWNSNRWTVFKFGNLTTVSIHGCDKLEHVFTRSMVSSLLQLQELHIRNCDHMGEIIVKDANVVVEEEEEEEVEEEESDGKMKKIELPCLRSLILDQLPCLKGFCLWNVDFSLPLLDTLKINRCQRLTVFTEGNSATPELREIETSFGSFYAEEDINSFIKNRQEEFKSNRRLK